MRTEITDVKKKRAAGRLLTGGALAAVILRGLSRIIQRAASIDEILTRSSYTFVRSAMDLSNHSRAINGLSILGDGIESANFITAETRHAKRREA